MITKLKYVGTKEGGDITQNNSYVALGVSAGYRGIITAVIIDDNGIPYATQTSIDDPNEWVLDTVTECGEQIYPVVEA